MFLVVNMLKWWRPPYDCCAMHLCNNRADLTALTWTLHSNWLCLSRKSWKLVGNIDQTCLFFDLSEHVSPVPDQPGCRALCLLCSLVEKERD
eukprot:1160634-Pelagomonas_calceolata.AAC.1